MRLSGQNTVCGTIAAIFAAWLSAPTALGAGSAPVSLARLASSADTIVIARILDGIMAQDTAILHLEVQEALKGAVQQGGVISVECRLSGDVVRHATDIEKDRGLFFLRKSDAGWSILPATSGYLSSLRRAFYVMPPVSKPTPFVNSARASIYERILAELAGSLEFGGGQVGGGDVDFMGEYRSSPTPSMKALFSQFKTSTHPVLRINGLRASLYDEGGLGLSALEDGLGRLSAAEITSIAEEIHYYLATTDTRAIASLARLAVSGAAPAQLRKASVRALARSHTAETLQHLARFLDDPDAELRALAVGGLAMFANNVRAGDLHQLVPGPWEYRTSETLLNSAMDAKVIQDNPSTVGFWKSWWAEHRAELQ